MFEENLFIKQTPNKGKSLFANRSFKKGETVFVVSGPIVTTPTIFTIPIGNGLYIDPVPVSNLAQFVNHSCNPNAGIKNRTVFVAFKDIQTGEEISIDYAMIVDRYSEEMMPNNLICKCGSQTCRGKLGSWSELPQEIKEKYNGFVSEYLLESSKQTTK